MIYLICLICFRTFKVLKLYWSSMSCYVCSLTEINLLYSWLKVVSIKSSRVRLGNVFPSVSTPPLRVFSSLVFPSLIWCHWGSSSFGDGHTYGLMTFFSRSFGLVWYSFLELSYLLWTPPSESFRLLSRFFVFYFPSLSLERPISLFIRSFLLNSGFFLIISCMLERRLTETFSPTKTWLLNIWWGLTIR